MPICTSCTWPVRYLYTVYETETNLRLEQCSRCHEFVDPYVEHDSLTILLDLVLLKLGVYRHLIYNRGTPPRRLKGRKGSEVKDDGDPGTVEKGATEVEHWLRLCQLGCALVFCDAFIRYSYLNKDTYSPEVTRWTKESAYAFLRVFLGTAAETLAFHGGIAFACHLLMALVTLIQRTVSNDADESGTRKEFRLSMISFSLFYSSIIKLFLLFLLTIWLPTLSQIHTPLPEWTKLLSDNSTSFLTNAIQIFDDDKLDREWIVRNILGGMCAGFGLRVILDIHPIFSTGIILAGWVAKTAVASVLSGWVGGDQSSGEAWLAYSIP